LNNNNVYSYLFSTDVNIIEDLKLMGPSAIDVEIRCLGPHAGGSNQLLGQFLQAAATVLETRRNYEVIHAYLGLFLKIHCSSLSEDAELCSLAKNVSTSVQESWSTIQCDFENTLGLVSFFTNAVI